MDLFFLFVVIVAFFNFMCFLNILKNWNPVDGVFGFFHIFFGVGYAIIIAGISPFLYLKENYMMVVATYLNIVFGSIIGNMVNNARKKNSVKAYHIILTIIFVVVTAFLILSNLPPQ